jgi:hypothetical protein
MLDIPLTGSQKIEIAGEVVGEECEGFFRCVGLELFPKQRHI